MKITDGVGLDSQCFTYLIDAIQGIGPPTSPPEEEKISLLRIYLFSNSTLFITPTVKTEYLSIRNQEHRESHESFLNVLFDEWPIDDTCAVKLRARNLEKDHNQKNDCMIFAEAENIGMRTLLSYDKEFLRRLRGKSPSLQLVKPSEYWAQLAIPRGMRPNKIPDRRNPLSAQTWWRWE